MKKIITVLIMLAASLLMASCAQAPTPIIVVVTSTPVPPTPTLVPPTRPVSLFKCNITTESYGFEIAGESGQATAALHDEKSSYQYAPSGQRSGITVDINRDLTFTNSKNTYKIVGKIVVDLITNSVSYDITATGGAFGDTPQTCKK